MNHIIIEGFICSGKGAVGRLVSKKTGFPFIDLDRVIAERMKMKTSEIYDRFGEPYYRAMESVILQELAEKTERLVIVLGSGVCVQPANAARLAGMGCVYYLRQEKKTMLAKIQASEKHKWIMKADWDERVLRLYREREPSYEATADVTIDVDHISPEEAADQIIAHEKAS